MAGISANVEIEGLDELVRDFKEAGGDARPLVTAALTNSANRTQQNIRTRAPHAFGTLQRSVLPEINYPQAEVAVNESYGKAVEEGTRPHRPPEAAIARWTKKKGIPGSAIWPIIKTIEKRGTKAQPFFAPGWEASISYIESQFDKVFERLYEVLAGGKR